MQTKLGWERTGETTTTLTLSTGEKEVQQSFTLGAGPFAPMNDGKHQVAVKEDASRQGTLVVLWTKKTTNGKQVLGEYALYLPTNDVENLILTALFEARSQVTEILSELS